MLDVRQDFPLLRNHPDLCYLDSAATSQKPDSVIQAVTHFLEHNNANVHRGVHWLSDEADGAYLMARETVASFIGAQPSEIIFTQNATAGINTVSRGYRLDLSTDAVYITDAEHNSNYLPWLHAGPVHIFSSWHLPPQLRSSDRTWLFAVTHLSNVLGDVTPVRQIARMAHAYDIPILVDAAQSAGHLPINVKELDADFLVFSGHKMLALTGIGVLYVRKECQDDFVPETLGGGTVDDVTENDFIWSRFPMALEAGTPPIVEAVSLRAAIDYLNRLGMDEVSSHISEISRYCNSRLMDIEICPYGSPDKHGLVSFNLDDIHPHDVAFELNKLNIAVRGGYQCAHLWHRLRKLKGSVRASFHVYNTLADVDRLIEGLEHVRRIFRRPQ